MVTKGNIYYNIFWLLLEWANDYLVAPTKNINK
jgi:hypothetical protein